MLKRKQRTKRAKRLKKTIQTNKNRRWTSKQNRH